jgi:hypothetical protein
MKKKVALLAVLMAMLAVAVVLQATRRPDEIDFLKYETSAFSQGGEDGVLEKIFSTIDPTQHYVVEFGCSDGVTYSSSRNLIVNHGWSGLLMDGDHDAIEKARKAYEKYPRAKIVEAWIYPGNVETLFEQHGVPTDLDLLVIDIDSNDYYVWRVIHEFRPKVVEIEFNASFPPPQKAVVQFHPLNYWDHSDYYGASIQSLYELGKKKGYELVYCTKGGLNLFFVDKQYYARFGIRDNSPAKLYRPPLYGVGKGGRAPNGRGHPPWDTWEDEKDGQRTKPYLKDLTWKEISIPKKFVPLP